MRKKEKKLQAKGVAGRIFFGVREKLEISRARCESCKGLGVDVVEGSL